MSTTPPQLPRVVREYIAAEKESARVWLRAEIDRFVGPLVEAVFERLTNKLMAMNMDWDKILPGARVVKREIKEEIKEENEMTLQNVVDNVPMGNEQIGDCVKREIKEEEEDGLMMHIKKEEEEEGETNEVDLDDDNEGGEADEVNPNNATHIDTWFDRWMRDEVELGDDTFDELIASNQSQNRDMSNASTASNEPSNRNLVDEESQVNPNTQHQFDESNNNGGIMQIEEEEEVGDSDTRDTDTVELAANEGDNEESSSAEVAQIGTTPAHLTEQSQANMSKSARHDKRKQKVPQAHNELTNRDNQHVQEKGQIDEATSRPTKRPRMDTTQPNNAQAAVTRPYPRQATDEGHSNEDRPHEEGGRMGSGQEPIGEEIVTECTTSPTQPNLAQPNRRLKCPHCLKSFEQRYDFTRHLRVHTGERPFQCDLCDKGFKHRADLSRHQLSHQNIKSFRCNECDKQFTQKPHLVSHLRTHSGDRPFECRHCDMSFAEPHTRNRHEQAIHLHVKPYRCKQCGHSATRQSDVISHIRVQHFGLPPSIKQQQAQNIIDDRDARELIEKV